MASSHVKPEIEIPHVPNTVPSRNNAKRPSILARRLVPSAINSQRATVRPQRVDSAATRNSLTGTQFYGRIDKLDVAKRRPQLQPRRTQKRQKSHTGSVESYFSRLRTSQSVSNDSLQEPSPRGKKPRDENLSDKKDAQLSERVSLGLDNIAGDLDPGSGQDGYFYCRVKNYYTLEAISQAEALREDVYCIKSQDGVIRVFQANSRRNGEKEFTNTSEWKRECLTFQACMELGYFRQAIVRRIFQRWLRAVKGQKINRAKNYLQQNLFHIDKMFASSLHSLWDLRLRLLHDIRATVITFNSQRALGTSNASGREALQQLERQLSNPHVSGIAAVDDFEKACWSLIESTVLSVLDMSTLRDHEVSSSGTEVKDTQKIMIQDQTNSAPRYLIHRLHSLSRLADCIITSALVQSAVVKLETTYSMVRRGHAHKTNRKVALKDLHEEEKDTQIVSLQEDSQLHHSGMNDLMKDMSLLHIEVITDSTEGSIQLQPPCDEIQDMLRKVENVFIQRLLKVKRFSGRIDLEKTVRQLRNFHGKYFVASSNARNQNSTTGIEMAFNSLQMKLCHTTGYIDAFDHTESSVKTQAGERLQTSITQLKRASEQNDEDSFKRAVVLSTDMTSRDNVMEFLVDSRVIVYREEVCKTREKIRESITSDYEEIRNKSQKTVSKLMKLGNNKFSDKHPNVWNSTLPTVSQIVNKISNAEECQVEAIREIIESIELRIQRLSHEVCIVNLGSLRTNLGSLQKIELFRARNDLGRLKRMLPIMLENTCVHAHDEISELLNGAENEPKSLLDAAALILKTEKISDRMQYVVNYIQDSKDLNRLLGILSVNVSEKSKKYLPSLTGMLDKLNLIHYKLTQRKEDTILSWRTHIKESLISLERQSYSLKDSAISNGLVPGASPENALTELLPLEEKISALYNKANELARTESVFSSYSENISNFLEGETEKSSQSDSREPTVLLKCRVDETFLMVSKTKILVLAISNFQRRSLELRNLTQSLNDRPAVAPHGQNVDLHPLMSASGKVHEAVSDIADALRRDELPEVCVERSNEATDVESVIETIELIRVAVMSELSPDHCDDILNAIRPHYGGSGVGESEQSKPTWTSEKSPSKRETSKFHSVALVTLAISPGHRLSSISIGEVLHIPEECRRSIKIIIQLSRKESELRYKFAETKLKWFGLKLNFVDWKSLIKVDFNIDLALSIEETEVIMSALASSPYSAHVRDEIEEFSECVVNARETLTNLIESQDMLEQFVQIFSSSSVKLELKKFHNTVRRALIEWDEMIQSIKQSYSQENTSQMEHLTTDLFHSKLYRIQSTLETVKKGVMKYLSSRRLLFPRFFFLHDNELILILEHALQMDKYFDIHVRRIFPDIVGGQFQSGQEPYPVLISVFGNGKEKFILNKHVGAGIDFFPVLARRVQNTLQSLLIELNNKTKLDRKTFDLRDMEGLSINAPAHLVILMARVIWCQQIESLLKNYQSSNSQEKIASTIIHIVDRALERSTSICSQLRGEEHITRNRLMLIRAESLLLHDLCSRDSAKSLINKGIDSIDHYAWTVMPKPKFNRVGDNLTVSINSTRFEYGYEYVDGGGGSSVIIGIHHSSDRYAWAIARATRALHCCAFLSSETVGTLEISKSLASFCGIFSPEVSLVDSVDLTSVGRLIQGAAACACWLRVTNLHGLSLSAATVLSHHIGLLIKAMQRGAKQFLLNGMNTPLNLQCTFIGTECTGLAFNSGNIPVVLREHFHATGVVTADPIRVAELFLKSRGIGNAISLINRTKLAIGSLLERHACRSDIVRCIPHSSVFEFFKTTIANSERLHDDVSLYIENAIMALESSATDDSINYDPTLCSPGERFIYRKHIKAARIDHWNYAEKTLVHLHTGLKFRKVAALLGPIAIGKTCLRRAFMKSIVEMNSPTKKRRARSGGIIRRRGRRASVSMPKGRRSSIVTAGTNLDDETSHYLFPGNLSLSELYGAVGSTPTNWVEGLLGHLLKMLKTEMIKTKAKSTSKMSMGESIQTTFTKIQYLIVDGCRRSSVLDALLNLVRNQTLSLPNGENVMIPNIPIQMIIEIADSSFLSSSHMSQLGLVMVGSSNCSVNLPGVFINMCNSISDQCAVQKPYQLSLLNHLREFATKLTVIDIIGVLPYRKRNNHLHDIQLSDSDNVLQCAVSAARILKAIVSVVYSDGEASFKVNAAVADGLNSKTSTYVVPDSALVAKAILSYAILWARRAFISEPEEEPTKGLLPGWLDDIGENLPLAIRRQKPLQMINQSGLLLLPSQLYDIPPVLELHGKLSFCHVQGNHQGQAYLLSVLCKAGMNTLITGPSRSGKTAIVQAVTSAIQESNSFYAMTCQYDPLNPHAISEIISETFSTSKCKTSNILSGIAGRQRVGIILDDVSMPEESKHTDVSESLRSLLSQGGFHDMSTLLWRGVQGFNFIITSRTLSQSPNLSGAEKYHQFCTIHISNISYTELQKLYCIVLQERLSSGGKQSDFDALIFKSESDLIQPLVKATMALQELYTPMRQKMGLMPAIVDPLLLELFKSPEKLKYKEKTGGDSTDGDKDFIQMINLHKSQIWFKLTRISYGGQCVSEKSAHDLEDAMKDNLHSALGIYGQAIKIKNRRLSAIDRAVMVSTSVELDATLQSVVNKVPPLLHEKSTSFSNIFDQNNLSTIDDTQTNDTSEQLPFLPLRNPEEAVQQMLGAGASEIQSSFKSIIGALDNRLHTHIQISTHDTKVGLGLVLLALEQYSSTIVKRLLVGPITEYSAAQHVHANLVESLMEAANFAYSNNPHQRVALVIENADMFPPSKMSLLAAFVAKRFPQGFLSQSEKKRIIQVVQLSLQDGTKLDVCWPDLFRRILEKVIVIVLVADAERFRCNSPINPLAGTVSDHCTEIPITPLSPASRFKIAHYLLKANKGLGYTDQDVDILAKLFVDFESVIDKGLEHQNKLESEASTMTIEESEKQCSVKSGGRSNGGSRRFWSDSMLIESVRDFLEVFQHKTERSSQMLTVYRKALAFGKAAKYRSSLLTAEIIALNLRIKLVSRKMGRLAKEVNQSQQLHGAESRRFFTADKDAMAIKLTMSKLVTEIDNIASKPNKQMAEARRELRSVGHSQLSALVNQTEIPHIIYRLAIACSNLIGKEIDPDDAESEDQVRDFLADPTVIAQVVRFDPQRDGQQFSLFTARACLSNPFSKDHIMQYGHGASCLWQWILACSAKTVMHYDINPLYKQMDNAQKASSMRQEALSLAYADKQKAAADLLAWQTSYKASVDERARLQEKLKRRQECLITCRECVNAVRPIKSEWESALQDIQHEQRKHVWNIWLGGGCMRYAAQISSVQRGTLMNKMIQFLHKYVDGVVSFDATFGCPSVCDVAEINATLIPNELHVGVYLLERVSLPRIPVIIDPDKIAMRFLLSSMHHDGDLIRTFDGDLKFDQFVLKAQIQRSTLVVQISDDQQHPKMESSEATFRKTIFPSLWNLISNVKKLREMSRHYKGFQIILTCDQIPVWLRSCTSTHFSIIDFSRPLSYTESNCHDPEIIRATADRISQGSRTRKDYKLMLKNIAEDSMQYNKAVRKLLNLVGGNFEDLIQDPRTIKDIHDAATAIQMLKQHLSESQRKKELLLQSNEEVVRAATTMIDLVTDLNYINKEFNPYEDKDPLKISLLSFLDIIMSLIYQIQNDAGLNTNNQYPIPDHMTIAKAVLTVFVTNTMNRRHRTHLTLTALIYAITRSSQISYKRMCMVQASIRKMKTQSEKHSEGKVTPGTTSNATVNTTAEIDFRSKSENEEEKTLPVKSSRDALAENLRSQRFEYLENTQEVVANQDGNQKIPLSATSMFRVAGIATKAVIKLRRRGPPAESELSLHMSAAQRKQHQHHVRALQRFAQYLTGKWDGYDDLFVDVNHSDQADSKRSTYDRAMFSFIESVLGNHETNILIHSEIQHSSLIHRFIKASPQKSSVNCLIRTAYQSLYASNVQQNVERQFTDKLLHTLLSSLSPRKALNILPLMSLSTYLSDELRMVMNNGGILYLPEYFQCGDRFQQCLELGYGPEWIIKHLCHKLKSETYSEISNFDVRRSQKSSDQNIRRRNSLAKRRSSRIQTISKKMKTAGRISMLAKLGGVSQEKNSNIDAGSQAMRKRRSSLRNAIRSSFIALETGNEKSAGKHHFVNISSDLRCCIPTSNALRNRSFLLISVESLLLHSTKSIYETIARKRRFSNLKKINLAWLAYLHIICATDLFLRLQRLHSTDQKKEKCCMEAKTHTNSVNVLFEIEIVIRFKFRQLLSNHDSSQKLKDFLNDSVISSMIYDLSPFYFFGSDPSEAAQFSKIFRNQVASIWNAKTGVLTQDKLGRFRVSTHLRSTKKYGIREMLQSSLELAL